jgi:tRNA A-37 threonylcarbamoyl transferase component Bud32
MNNLKGKNLCNPEKFMRHKNPLKNTVNKGILELKKGTVWVGCPDKDCAKIVAIKRCKQHEFNLQRTLHKIYPKIVPDVYEGINCDNGFYMYSEYIKGGSLKKFKNSPDKIIYRVLVDLKLIHKQFPFFRHNDLHVDNVLVKDGVPQLYDFELSNWHGNPEFNAELKDRFG